MFKYKIQAKNIYCIFFKPPMFEDMKNSADEKKATSCEFKS